MRGYNAYVSPGPKHEYQIDIFFLSDLEDEERQQTKMAMCATDAFTKALTVAPPKSKGEAFF